MSFNRSATNLYCRLKEAKRLPSPPGTAIRVLTLCRDEAAEVQEIADVIMADPALSGRLLKFANSPMAGMTREVVSVREALLLLGLRTVKLTALGFSLAAPQNEPNCQGFDLPRFWKESFMRGVIARRIAKDHFKVDREEAFTAALLAGLGQLAMAQGLRELYAQVLAAASQPGKCLLELEREKFGCDHQTFSATLLEQWGLPKELVEAVANQCIELEAGRAATTSQRMGRVVNIAGQLTPYFLELLVKVNAKPSPRLEALLRDDLMVPEQGMDQLTTDVIGDFREVSALFDVELDSVSQTMELYADAQEEATRVGMVAQLERARALQDNASLLKKATTDPLTGIANRAKFDERLKEELAKVKRGHGCLALLIFDIDHFKKFNDCHGHQVGDLVLKRVAVAVANCLREVDLAARYGGEEFAVIAPYTDPKGACVVAARIQRCVAELVISVMDKRLNVTISSGLAVTQDYAEMPSPADLITDADKQLYLSKGAGRNTWSYRGRSASQLLQRNQPAPVVSQ